MTTEFVTEAGKAHPVVSSPNLPEMIDIKPDRGGAYIDAASEAYNGQSNVLIGYGVK